MVWQPYWINEDNWTIFFSENRSKKIKTLRMSSTPHGIYRVIMMTSSVKWYCSHNWLNQNPYLKKFKLYLSDLQPDVSEELKL